MIAGDILGERARLTPDKLALIDVASGERYSYSHLNERAARCALLWTRVAGVKRGYRVGMLAHNCVEYVDAFFAAGKSGVILVALNPRQTAHELAHVVRDAGLSAVMYERALGDTVSALRSVCDVRVWIALGPGTPDIDYGRETSRMDAREFVAGEFGPEDLYCLLYTSGTTGLPKGVMIPHRQVIWNAYNTAMCWGLREDDVAPIITPMCHAGGLFVFLTPVFAAGGTIALHRGFDASEVWGALERYRYTVLMAVPTIFKMLMEAPSFATANVESVRWLISGGAPLPLYIIEAYQRRGITFKQGYGLTEVGVNCFAMSAEDSRRKPGSIGAPMMFTDARLVDAAGNDVRAGEVGELWLRGPHVCRGYWNNPEATAAAIDDGGWFHTGDEARRDLDGFFYIAGRAKDMFISGGLNVYPAEIESALLLHPSVEDVAVIGVADEKWGEVGVAFVVTRPGCATTGTELAAFLAERLAKYKLPRRYEYVEALPRTPYGKVLKADIQKRYAAAGSTD